METSSEVNVRDKTVTVHVELDSRHHQKLVRGTLIVTYNFLDFDCQHCNIAIFKASNM